MAEIKISQLDDLASIPNSAVICLVYNGVTYKCTKSNFLAALIAGAGTLNDVLFNGNASDIDLVVENELTHVGTTISQNGIYFKNSAGKIVIINPDYFANNYHLIIPNKAEGAYETIVVTSDLATKADLVSGKVPQSQLPSYVDDILEGYLDAGVFYNEIGHTTVITAETGKIYIDIPTGKEYRYSGSAYIQITNGLLASTNDLTEGSTNLYYTTARVLATLLSGISFTTGGEIISTDSILVALGKIQNQLNNVVKIIYKSSAISTVITNNTGNNILANIPIVAGTLPATSCINVDSISVTKTGTGGTTNIRIYISPNNGSLTGATQIGALFMTATLIYAKMRRKFDIYGGNLYYSSVANITTVDDVTTSATADISSMSYNVSNTYYLIVTGQLSSTADTLNISGIRITN